MEPALELWTFSLRVCVLFSHSALYLRRWQQHWTWVCLVFGVVDSLTPISLFLFFSITYLFVYSWGSSPLRLLLCACCPCLIQILSLTFSCPLPPSFHCRLSCQIQVMTVLLLFLVSGAAGQWGEHRSVSLRARLWQALRGGNPGNTPRGRDNFLAPLKPLPGRRILLEEPALDSEEAVEVSVMCVGC